MSVWPDFSAYGMPSSAVPYRGVGSASIICTPRASAVLSGNSETVIGRGSR